MYQVLNGDKQLPKLLMIYCPLKTGKTFNDIWLKMQLLSFKRVQNCCLHKMAMCIIASWAGQNC